MNINELVHEAHSRAVKSGWWDQHIDENGDAKDLSADVICTKHMLIVTEIAEATEEVRSGKPAIYWLTPTGMVTQDDVAGGYNLSVGKILAKPEGEAVELADAVIRIMDYFGFRGWDLEKVIKMKMEYNDTRAHRHGGKLV